MFHRNHTERPPNIENLDQPSHLLWFRFFLGLWCFLAGLLGIFGNLLTLIAIPYAARRKKYKFIYVEWVAKKHIILKLMFFVYISGTTWAKKNYLHILASLSKERSDEKIIFQIRLQIQLIFAKTLFWQKKVSYWKKSAILKTSKTFFHGSKVWELNLHKKYFLAQKSSRNLFKSS